MINIANRLKNINEYYFSTKLQEIAKLNEQGKNIINLGIGSPDLAPHQTVIETLQLETAKTTTHQYQSYRGAAILRNAVAEWYANYYNTTLNAQTEILPLIGSKEGIMHICMTYLNTGDEALIPNPGYPTYASAVQLAGGTCRTYTLTEATNWLPQIDALEKEDLSKVKIMFVNYPHMPTGAGANLELFTTLIAFAKRNNILLVNDNPYSFILNENPISILQIDGAMDCCIELNSLSKSHNMAGWRVGFLLSNENNINNIVKFKSNMDSGMFLPIQIAAAKALQLDNDWYKSVNAIYKKRKEIVLQILDKLKCTYTSNQQGLFVWAKINNDYKDSYAMSDAVLYNHYIFITPGAIFGSEGNNYIRISLCQNETILEEALKRITPNP